MKVKIQNNFDFLSLVPQIRPKNETIFILIDDVQGRVGILIIIPESHISPWILHTGLGTLIFISPKFERNRQLIWKINSSIVDVLVLSTTNEPAYLGDILHFSKCLMQVLPILSYRRKMKNDQDMKKICPHTRFHKEWLTQLDFPTLYRWQTNIFKKHFNKW